MNSLKGTIPFLALISSSAAFATPVSASLAERRFLCAAVNSALEAEQADAGLDEAACVKNRSRTIRPVGANLWLVAGQVKFNAPNRPAFKLLCRAVYSGAPKQENLVGKVTCR